MYLLGPYPQISDKVTRPLGARAQRLAWSEVTRRYPWSSHWGQPVADGWGRTAHPRAHTAAHGTCNSGALDPRAALGWTGAELEALLDGDLV